MVDETNPNEQKPEQTKKPKRSKTDKAPKPEKTEKAVEFPVESRINNYGFIFMWKRWLAALGWENGTKFKIAKNADGSITVCKA